MAQRPIWTNDMATTSTHSNNTTPPLKKQKLDSGEVARVATYAVPNRKPGGAGMTLSKTHIKFTNDDDEDDGDDAKNTGEIDATQIVA